MTTVITLTDNNVLKKKYDYAKYFHTYYKFIDKNLLNLMDTKRSKDLLTHVETINDLIEQENSFA